VMIPVAAKPIFMISDYKVGSPNYGSSPPSPYFVSSSYVENHVTAFMNRKPLHKSKHTTGVGTSLYASPEQINHKFYNERTDIFSLGVILFEMYSPKFDTQMERHSKIDDARAGRLTQDFQSKWTFESKLILSCVSSNPSERPSAQEIFGSDMFLTVSPSSSSDLWFFGTTPSPSPKTVVPNSLRSSSSSVLSPTSSFNVSSSTTPPTTADTVQIPRVELETMQKRIFDLERLVQSLSKGRSPPIAPAPNPQQQQVIIQAQPQLTHHNQETQTITTANTSSPSLRTSGGLSNHIIVPPNRAARGESAVIGISPLTLHVSSHPVTAELQPV
jgi:serine/threonine protein kinase